MFMILIYLFNFLIIPTIYLLKVNKILFNVFGEVKKIYLHRSHVCGKLDHLKASYFQINNIPTRYNFQLINYILNPQNDVTFIK